jgi:glycosyltransferase involved in cell wall biosynthesis
MQARRGTATMLPLVSVIVPVHNGEKFLLEAVGSIRRQCYPSLELIIVNDGSTDGTADLIAHLGSEVLGVHQTQRGPAAARNRGLAMSRGELIAFLDADDLWPRDKLHTQVNFLLEHLSLDVVLGRIQIIRAEDPKLEGDVLPDPVIDVQLGCALFRRHAFSKVGRFDESLCWSEDYDWFLRAREQDIRLTVLDEVALLYRRHRDNMTRSPDRQGYQLTRVLKASLDRRRARGNGQTQSLPKLLGSDE